MDFDFSFILFVLSIITGGIWGAYLLILKNQGKVFDEANEPWYVEQCRSLFPVILIVFILRSFLAEPFRIPSGSMMPTLLVGDFILVNKFTYGIRLPVINQKIIPINEPEHGDIVVFRFPKDPSVDYIKRIIGLPGDKISYENKKLTVNGAPAGQISMGTYMGYGQGEDMTGAEHLLENLAGIEHSILVRHDLMSAEGSFTVPEGHYFVMGDNRDNSNDSRYCGFVTEQNLVGKAFFIWFNLDLQSRSIIGLNRIGTVLK